MKKKTTREARRGMSLADWRKQNAQPWTSHHNLSEEDVVLINTLYAATGGHGISKRMLALLYFPAAKDVHSAVSQFSYETHRCRGLSEALAALHHDPRKACFTCAQTEALFLLYGSPGE